MGVHNRYRAKRSLKITNAGFLPLPSIDWGWTFNGYYFLDNTKGQRMLFRAVKEEVFKNDPELKGYDTETDIYASCVFLRPEYARFQEELKKPARYLKVFREEGYKYLIRVMPEYYLPTLWVVFDKPLPKKRAGRIVCDLMPKIADIARKCAKADGEIN